MCYMCVLFLVLELVVAGPYGPLGQGVPRPVTGGSVSDGDLVIILSPPGEGTTALELRRVERAAWKHHAQVSAK